MPKKLKLVEELKLKLEDMKRILDSNATEEQKVKLIEKKVEECYGR
jgi:hypothetical protein